MNPHSYVCTDAAFELLTEALQDHEVAFFSAGSLQSMESEAGLLMFQKASFPWHKYDACSAQQTYAPPAGGIARNIPSSLRLLFTARPLDNTGHSRDCRSFDGDDYPVPRIIGNFLR